jgi:TRAP transporter TAXI family solute receptor
MPRDKPALVHRYELIRTVVVSAAVLVALLWTAFQLLQPAPQRRIVMASANESGIYHQFAQRYIAILKREGVKVEERMTAGAAENLNLLLDPASRVDVAFLQGGVVDASAAKDVVMLASVYYEPLWIFYRDPATLSQINQLDGKRIAVGAPGSGTRALVDKVLRANGLVAANGIARGNTEIAGIGGADALRGLKAREVDAALFVGGAQTPTIQQALRDPAIKLMSLDRADAYPRRFPWISKLTLPAGTIDLAINVPDRDVQMIGTKAMLGARDGLHPALINLLIDAAREIHGNQGYFEAAGEFPGTAPVDLPVSPFADQHKRFGPSFLYHYLPFWVATVVERLIILLLPLAVILVPLFNYLPQYLQWRVRSRIYRWYGELSLLEKDVQTRKGDLPVDQWLKDLDRIEHAVEQIHTPDKFASEAYTLREHVGLVRRAVIAKAGAASAAWCADHDVVG